MAAKKHATKKHATKKHATHAPTTKPPPARETSTARPRNLGEAIARSWRTTVIRKDSDDAATEGTQENVHVPDLQSRKGKDEEAGEGRDEEERDEEDDEEDGA